MSGNGYKALGFVVWKVGVWYVKRRYAAPAKQIGAGALGVTAAAAVVVVVLAQRRNGTGG